MTYQKILVAKLRHHGDVLLSSPVFSFLKETYPDARIDAYIYKDTFPILEGHPAISEYILYDKKKKKTSFFSKITYEIRLLWKIFRARYDLVINLTEGDRAALAAFVSRAKTRIGIDPEGSGMLAKAWCYTHLSKRCPHIRHSVERNLDVLRSLGLFPTFSQRELFIFLPQESKERMRDLLEMHGFNFEGYVLVHPVSRWLFKCLPETTIAQILSYLVEKNEKIILTSSSDPEEMAMNQRILSLFNHDCILDLSGALSIKELAVLIDNSKLLVCVDSLPLHLASALKKKVVAIFGPTSERTWAPWRNPKAVTLYQEFTCRPCYRPGCADSKKSDCLDSFPIETILESLEQQLLELKIHS